MKWTSLAYALLHCATCVPAAFAEPSSDRLYTIEVVQRHLYGPGPFPDQALPSAWLRKLSLDTSLKGLVRGENNLQEKPNVSGEVLQGKEVDGKLSDGTLINENIDMANAVIMNGQFNLLLAAVFGGPNNGDTHLYMDEMANWWIKDDIAIDPGFAEGIVKIDDFTFSTQPRVIPVSVQTEKGYPGGTNRIGSLEAGRVARGRLGDTNGDGFLDGVFNAIGRFPMESIFLPGAPFVQLFEFTSDIPVSPLRSASLTVASARSHANLVNELMKSDPRHPDIEATRETVVSLISESKERLKSTIDTTTECQDDCVEVKNILLNSPLFSSTGIPDGDLHKMLNELYHKLTQLDGRES